MVVLFIEIWWRGFFKLEYSLILNIGNLVTRKSYNIVMGVLDINEDILRNVGN